MTINKTKPTINKESINKENVFKTADFILSAFLFYSGVNLIRTEPYPDDKNKNRKFFVFEKTDQVEILMNHYISSDPTVKLKKFVATQRQLKKMIYED